MTPLATLMERGEPAVLATVVRTHGSTYRKTGAEMLVRADGETEGLLSGGCLEDVIAQEAVAVLASGVTKRLFFDLMRDEEYLVGYGKGCFGQLTILLEPLTASRPLLASLSRLEGPTGVALVYEADPAFGIAAGSRVVLAPDHTLTSDIADNPRLVEALGERLRAQSVTGKPQSGEWTEARGTLRYALFSRRPPVDLLLFGAGPDAVPLGAFARQLGWDVRVFDHRLAYVRPDRFPGASVSHYVPEAVADTVQPRAGSAVVVMTHNLMVDAQLLQWAATQPLLSYVGLLGPAHRRARLFELAAADGCDVAAALGGRLHSPIGLDLGGASETDIALAVAAQIQQVHHRATGRHKGVVSAREGVAGSAAASFDEDTTPACL